MRAPQYKCLFSALLSKTSFVTVVNIEGNSTILKTSRLGIRFYFHFLKPEAMKSIHKNNVEVLLSQKRARIKIIQKMYYIEKNTSLFLPYLC